MSVDVKAFYRGLLELDTIYIESLVHEYLKQGVSGQVILSGGLIRAMGIVGQEFKAKELWVPEVLLAARNMHKGIDALRSVLAKEDIPSRGIFVIGTVKGDIHDIGKNIVAILMEAHGFKVIDLGVDVSTNAFVEAVAKHRPDIVGMSALLTTTMQEMKKVIVAVRKSMGHRTPKLIVGGAPVTQKFAYEIGADGYGDDAISGVEVALKLLAKSRGAL
jgi:5-methyltetrahydrofolate--homocysteine methyltransferase